MAKKIFNRRTLALVLALVMCFSALRVTAYAAPDDNRGNWNFAYYLGQEYLGNAPGKNPKPDPVGYGFQGVITSLTFQDDAGITWTFNWNYEANGEWRITGSNVTRDKATAWPQVTSGKTYVGYCGNTAYTFTLSADGSAKEWTYVNESSRYVNWFYYIRFIREYTVNVFYQNETGSVEYKGVKYAAQDPLVRYFHFLYPNGNIIDDSEFEDGEYTDPVTLLPQDYLSEEMLAQGYELKYATDADGRDVMATGVTISLLGENVLNVYCTLIPPKTENYTVVHAYYTEGTYDGRVDGGTVEVEKNTDFAQIVADIEKLPEYNGGVYSYISYNVDPAAKVITLTYSRQLPTYDYTVTYNANFGEEPETKADSENVTGVKDAVYTITADENTFVRENYTFLGWNTEADGSGTAYAPGAEISLTAENNSEVLYAQWQEHEKYDYTLVYNANFGASPETKTDSESIFGTYALSHGFTVDNNTFVREHYTFVGWNTKADGSGTAYAPGAALTLTAENNTEVLYAQWQEHRKYDYSLFYNANFGEEPETRVDGENITGIYDKSRDFQVDNNGFVRENYTFIGWNTEADGSGTAYAPGDVLTLTAENNTEVLYAQWQENPKYDYSLIYNANFGADPETKADSENVAGVYVDAYGITVDTNSFVRENYSFVGWNTEADGSGTAYTPGDVVALTAENNTEILYAQWQEYPKYDYQLIYNANFGENPETRADDENITGTYSIFRSFGVDENPFVREYYFFTGWNTEADGSGTAYAPGDELTLTVQNNNLVLFAQWQEYPKYDYTLIYNANFGADPETRADSENVTGVYSIFRTFGVDANPFVREYYFFTGWNTEADGSGTAYAPGEELTLSMSDNTEVLYAQWQEYPKYDYTLIYNANFGDPAETDADSENISATYAVSYTFTVDENTFSREHYTFVGWNTESDGSGTAYAPGAALTLTADNNTAVLYAQWQEHPKYDYALTYNANFGENPETKADEENISGTYALSITMTVDANSFVRENYTFLGWNTRSDGTGIAFAPGDALYLTSDNNTALLYAQWQENPRYDYSLIYNANFGTEPETKTDSESISGIFATSHTIGVDANSFVRENYTFVGWNTQADGSGEAFAPGTKVLLTVENNTAVLYAQWMEYPKYDYTLIYNANFGQNPETKADSENVTDTYALRCSFGVDANSFVRENYTFTGWNTEADGSGTAYSFGDVVTLTADRNTEVLYAQWTENPKYLYVVVYHANFGERPALRTDDESVYNTYAAEYTIGVDANTFVRENYTFIGWATSPEGEVVYQAGDSITFVKNGMATLYAKWVEHDKYSYTLIYNGNGGALADESLSYGDSENIDETYVTAHSITVDANTFARENYTFTGWNTEADGSGTAYTAEDVVALTAENNTATLYAQWAENPKYDYSLVYDANFGENPETREDGENVTGTYAAEYSITVDENTFEREGYTFVGWAVAPEGEVVYRAEDVIRFAEGGSAVLYAQWEINEYDYTVRYMVRVDGNQYAPFQGILPEGAPVGGKAVYGQIIDETTLDVPTALNDGTYTYDFTALEGIVVPQGSNIVFVYYTYITPQPPVDPPVDPADPTDPVDPPGEPPVDEPADPQNPGDGGLVEIPDDEVPLADVPQTGDPMLIYAGLTVLSGMGLLGLSLKKKKEDTEA